VELPLQSTLLPYELQLAEPFAVEYACPGTKLLYPWSSTWRWIIFTRTISARTAIVKKHRSPTEITLRIECTSPMNLYEVVSVAAYESSGWSNHEWVGGRDAILRTHISRCRDVGYPIWWWLGWGHAASRSFGLQANAK